jgi:hypothetical protein
MDNVHEQSDSQQNFTFALKYKGARGRVVVKALCCKPEGRGFDTR